MSRASEREGPAIRTPKAILGTTIVLASQISVTNPGLQEKHWGLVQFQLPDDLTPNVTEADGEPIVLVT